MKSALNTRKIATKPALTARVSLEKQIEIYDEDQLSL